MKRFDCLKSLLSRIASDTITVTSFRGTGEEWAYLRGNKLNFYGFNMGLCTPVAAGVARAQPSLNVIALDSDGSFLLDIGILVTIAKMKLKNLAVVVFDNEAYGPYGRTVTEDTVSLDELARTSGIERAVGVDTMDSFDRAIGNALKFNGASFIVAKIENYTERLEGTPYKTRNGRLIKEDFCDSLKALLKEKYQT